MQQVHIAVRWYAIDTEHDHNVADQSQAIALHMLQVLAFRWRPPPKFALVVLAIIWLVILVLLAVPSVVQGNIYAPIGYCKPSWTRLGLNSCLTPLYRVLDRGKHYGENRTRTHLDVVGSYTECHCIRAVWPLYQAMEGKVGKNIYAF